MSDNERSRESPPPPAPASGDGVSSSAPVVAVAAAAAQVTPSAEDTSAPGRTGISSPDLPVVRLRRAETFPFGSEEAPLDRATVLAGLATAEQAGREARQQSVVLCTYVPLPEDELTLIVVLKISSTKLALSALVLLGSPALLLSIATAIITETSIARMSSRQRAEREFRREFYRRPFDREGDESDSASEGEQGGNDGRAGGREVELSYEGVLAMEREWDEVRGLRMGGEDEVGVVVDGEGEAWGVMNERESWR
ncbi:unnamed protein product [Zymoseptoria tritici ST99CH_3D7]|uniref:Uncharacterized protein n=1 Tax=Zymoseptoria tritici (strain ST99CH_3D7) TaxID=1276538 RepID=A0A1X7RZM8_ZYMT9|nr:unnamed protein product [Zymoseptoria tritici ST99CH_3D7]